MRDRQLLDRLLATSLFLTESTRLPKRCLAVTSGAIVAGVRVEAVLLGDDATRLRALVVEFAVVELAAGDVLRRGVAVRTVVLLADWLDVEMDKLPSGSRLNYSQGSTKLH